MGVALGVYPDLTLPALLGFLVWAAGLACTRMSSVGSMAAAIAFPVLYEALPSDRDWGERWPFLGFAVLATALVLVRHRANIARLLAGTETRVGSPRGGPSQVDTGKS